METVLLGFAKNKATWSTFHPCTHFHIAVLLISGEKNYIDSSQAEISPFVLPKWMMLFTVVNTRSAAFREGSFSSVAKDRRVPSLCIPVSITANSSITRRQVGAT